jgi:hypothetical protein
VEQIETCEARCGEALVESYVICTPDTGFHKGKLSERILQLVLTIRNILWYIPVVDDMFHDDKKFFFHINYKLSI